MANQYTKKKEADAKKQKTVHQQKMGRGTRVPTDKHSGSETGRWASASRDKESAAPEVFMLNLDDLFKQKFPQMGRCDDKAKTQPHFTLLACDNFTPMLIRSWINLAMQYGVPQTKVAEANYILAEIEKWRTAHPMQCKKPD